MFPKFDKAPGDEKIQEEKFHTKTIDAAAFVDSAVLHSPEELEKAREVYQKHLERMQPYFKVFAGSLSVPFEFTTSVSTAAFDHHKGKVLLGVEWFVKKQLSPEQASWVCLHELSHLADFAEDSKRYKEVYTKEDFIEGVERIGTHAEKSYRRIFGEGIPDEMKSKIEKEATRGLISFFYNTTDDIWVNNNVSHKASMYSRDLPAGKDITKLYREVLFPTADFKNSPRGESPRHMQFGNALLRKEMVPDEELVVSDDVREALERKVKFDRRLYSSQEIINNYIKPGAGRVVAYGRRNDVLNETLRPLFEELYKKDIDDSLERLKKQKKDKKKKEQENPGEQEKTDGDVVDDKNEQTNPEDLPPQEQIPPEIPDDGSFFEDYHEQAKEETPDIINPEDLEEWYEYAKEEERKEVEQEAARAKENEERKKAADDKDWCEKNKIEFNLYQEYQRIESLVAPYREDLAHLWRRIAFGESLGREKIVTSGAKSGTKVHIPSLILSYPDIMAGDFGSARVMERTKYKEKKVEKPERIEISLILDRSGSMYTKGNIKTDVATQAVVLLLSSIEDFNGYLASARGRTKSPLHADTEVIVFGDNARRVKSFRGNRGAIDEKRDVIGVMGHVYEDYGYTFDNKALEIVSNSVTSGSESLIKKGKVMKIVFEVTDGVSDEPGETTKEIQNLDRRGVIVRAFQIGGSEEDKRRFGEIWNSEGKQHGFAVGGNVRNLAPAIMASLEEYLGDIEL